MKDAMDAVRIFHVAAELPVIDRPQFPDDARVKLRGDLLEEEYLEYVEAVALRDIVGVADALADMAYIIAGTALEFGIPLGAVFNEVQRTNMAKVVPDPVTGKLRRRADGKILKPDGWQKPDIRGVLFPEQRASDHNVGEIGACDCCECSNISLAELGKIPRTGEY